LASSIPLVRASAIIGLETWLLQTGRPAAALLAAAGLPASPRANPSRLVSFHGFMSLLERLSRDDGPDLGARIATPGALMMLGAPAQAIRTSQTVRDALWTVSRNFHHHVSQVFFLVQVVPGGVEVISSIPIDAPPTVHHQAQQHIACLVRNLGSLTGQGPLPASIRMMGHPVHGVDHLRPFLGDDIRAVDGRQVVLRIPDSALDACFPWTPDADSASAEPLDRVAQPTLSSSASILIAGMIEDGNPSLDRLAIMAGRSRRTMQRLLEAEGTSFIELLDEVRRDLALSRLTGSEAPVAAIAGDVGYKTPSSLSRAVRRWTESNPRRLRRAPPA
jgi:AraC-like DNA-binding protein